MYVVHIFVDCWVVCRRSEMVDPGLAAWNNNVATFERRSWVLYLRKL
jgi:hypothetical protein